MDSQPETPQRRRDLYRDPTDDAPVTAPGGPAATTEPVAEPAAPAPATSSRRRRLLVLLLSLTALIAVVDQITKCLAEARLEQGVIVPVLGDLLGLQLVYNPGAAFSFATGMTWVFTIIMVVVAVVVLRVSRRLGSLGWALALGMLLGGCLGNLYDRLFRDPGFARGHVVDFINYNGWFVGNIADIAIVGAAILIAVLALRGREIDGSLASDAAERADDERGTDA
ncbi:signal peptidase II [Georgenia subflava]|uniref:Lipoprotein signal peptidase n=1 Tax=Georgenia subflava TaxID=1622177 RepID=A0A6N7ENH7_9MICO|nr:signal peptidase II [Georgenia subflava]MPV37696.1 signal peptidase II [Georgenia subflava]